MASRRKLNRLIDRVAETHAYPVKLFRTPHSLTEQTVKVHLARKHRVRTEIKAATALHPDRAITGPHVIWLPVGYEDLTPERKARLMVHECAHVLSRGNRWLWYGRYLVPWQRVIAECWANGAALTYARFSGEASEEIRKAIDLLPDKLWEKYALRRAFIRKPQLDEVVIKGLRQALKV